MALEEEEIDRLSEEFQDSLQLAQAGLAAEIADHDLGQTYHGIKATLGTLQAMLRRVDKVQPYLKLLADYFNHLELQYRQLQPLYRARRRRRQWIQGSEIEQFIQSLMEHTLRSNRVSLELTPAFEQFKVFESSALVMPVFINLIDNAVYWVRKGKQRRIRLDAQGAVVTVCDTGPGIRSSMHEAIFERFVTTKPRGRGLGLYIARQVLRTASHDIWATDERQYRTLSGACFCVRFSDRAMEGEPR
jgi:signal transduction histidine kinase